MGLFDKLLKKSTVSAEKVVYVCSPVNGTVRTLESLKDGMFSEKMLGDGIVVLPSDGTFTAPVSGMVEAAFPTGHAFGIKTETGAEILIHIGIDTVNMEGKGFSIFAVQGDRVKAGDKLVTVDLDTVKEAGYPIETMIIVSSGELIQNSVAEGTEVKAGERLFELK